MRYRRFQKSASLVTFLILMVAMIVMVQAQYPTSNPQNSNANTNANTNVNKSTATQAAAAKTGTPTLTATLVDAEKKAAQKAATVQVKTTGIRLIDPATVGEKPRAGQGHLHYQVDGGPIIATTATKLSFHELSS
ncbi:MAG TPA: hypothetical protein VFH31_06620, partial [Pyrinomonadaceae bacterium]|nr:hypothetical protein [Pyrinomonadaceae bacterium]